MATRKHAAEVRVVYHRDGFSTRAGHIVRSKMEGTVCDWLTLRRVAHSHGGEVFIVKSGPSHVAHLYVPDIVLQRKNGNGKTVILECFQTAEPKEGGARLLADFRLQSGDRYHVVLIVKRGHVPKAADGTFDALVKFENLDTLARQIR